MGKNTQEAHRLRGPVDRSALITIRDIINSAEPIATAELDTYLNPTSLAVTFEDGLCEAETARMDIQWTTQDDYKFHYTDSENVNFRWGRHPHGGDYIDVEGFEHFHPPPDASANPYTVEESCIQQPLAKLVTRAVLKLWRVAYHNESLSHLNSGRNPP